MTKLVRFAVLFMILLSPSLALAATPMVAGGSAHSVALKSDGTVWTWGSNAYGQLGVNSTTTPTSNTPVQVTGLSGITAIAAGGGHTLALKSDGTVWAWGLNTSGQLGNLSNVNSSIPVQVNSISTVTAIAAGDAHSMALKADGTVWAWGGNVSGQLGNGFATNTNTPVMAGISAVKSIKGGTSHSLALKLDGTVWAWGLNSDGQLGNGSYTISMIPIQVTGLSGITAISAGGAHNVALKSDNTVSAWGLNSSGQLGNGSFVSSNLPVASNITGVSEIAAGLSHTLAIKSDNTTWAWGANGSGQLGNGTFAGSSSPVASLSIQVGSYVASAIGAGASHSVVLRSDGAVGAWGMGASGRLGNGATSDSSSPVQVLGPGGVGVLDLIASTSSTLSALTLSSGTLAPAFASGTTAYSATVGNTTASITLSPTASDITSTIKVNGTIVASGGTSGPIALNVGSNTITITVTAQDGLTNTTYTLAVTRSLPGTDATLSALVFSGGTLSPNFVAATTAYAATVGNATTSVTITPTATDSAATIKVNGSTVVSGSPSGAISLNLGSNTITVVVTASDGSTTKTYTAVVTRSSPGSDATLSAVSLSSGTLKPSFVSGTSNYTAAVDNSTTSVTVTPVASDTAATIKVNGNVVASGSASSAVPLELGSNTITLVVTAQNGTSTKSYTLTVSRATPGIRYLDFSSLSMVYATLPSVLDMKNGDGPQIESQMIATLSKSLGIPLSYENQNSSGAMVLGFAGGKFAFLPLTMRTGDTRPDGIWYHPSGYGLLDVVSSGTVVTIAPTIVNLGDFAWLLPFATARIDRTGTLVVQLGSVGYVVTPSYLVKVVAPGTPKIDVGSDGKIAFTDFSGNSQALNPAFAEPDSLSSLLYSLDKTSTMSIQLDGTATIKVFGLNYVLKPELNISPIPAEHVGNAGWQDATNHFWLRSQRYSGTAQGFSATQY